MGPDGAPGLRPRQRVLRTRREKRSGFPGAGSSGGAHPSPTHGPVQATLSRWASEGARAAVPSSPLWESGQGKGLLPTERGPAGHRRDSVTGRTRRLSLEQGPATEWRRATCPGPRCPASAPVIGDVSLLEQASMGAPQGPAAKTSGCPCRPWKAGKAPPPRSTCPGPSASQGWQECHLWVGTGKAANGAYCVHFLRGPGAPVGQESGPRVPEGGSGARGGRRGSQKSQADASTPTPPSTLTVQGVKVNEHSPLSPALARQGPGPGASTGHLDTSRSLPQWNQT